jgi:hypothetical protein
MPLYRIRHGLSLLAVAVVAAALFGGPAPARAQSLIPTLSVCAAPLSDTGVPLTISGTSQINSAPFELPGGAYRVDWSMRTGSSSLSYVDLDDVTTGRLAQQVVSPSAASAASAVANTGFGGQTFIYGVKPGHYYLDVRAPGDWSVTLTPIAV